MLGGESKATESRRMSLIDEETLSTTETGLARRWLGAFDRALAERDERAAAALFEPDGHWRDIVSFTWHLRTFSGTAQLRAAFAATVPVARPSRVRLRTSPPPRRVRRGGVESIEAFLEFETKDGAGEGVVRLASDDHGVPRASVLLTTLREITGFEELVGQRRPTGRAYSRRFGGPNWLDERRAALEYADRDPAVLVVGGGQAGLSIAARLGRLGVDTLVVDRHSRVGDNWRLRYHSLTLHNQVWVNHLPYLPFPDSWPTYVPKDMLANWFESYVDAMEINFWTGTEFVGANYDRGARRWTATVRRAGAERVLRPRHIVMATGVSGIPNIPPIPGLDDFAGQVVHSHAYRDGKRYAGRPALVVGTGNSGHDIAQDLHSSGAPVTVVQRGSTTVVRVDPTAQKVYSLYTEGLPTAACDLIFVSSPYPELVRGHQLVSEQMRRDDEDLLAALRGVGFRTDYGEDDTGWQLKYLRRGGGYYLNVGCSELIAAGEIGLVQYSDLDRIMPEGARLRDGRVVPAELIVLATGYHDQTEQVRACFGDDEAARVGPIWGFDEQGELRNMWKRTAQDGLWFHAGSLAQCRIFSKYLALQIKACEIGLIEPTHPGPVS
jgi:cation diffusion facilitator CzcD-associated flavoprotein CzcO